MKRLHLQLARAEGAAAHSNYMFGDRALRHLKRGVEVPNPSPPMVKRDGGATLGILNHQANSR